MKTLILGGPRQGEWLELAATQKSWVDLLHGETYLIRTMTYAIEDPDNRGTAAELYRLRIAVHPSLRGPIENRLGEMALYQVVALPFMDQFMRTNAEPQELLPLVPDSPAELDGGE